MPIYEFKCRACNYIFEELIRNQQDREALRCPACSATELERLLSACGIIGSNPGSIENSGLPSACSSCVTKDCSTCK